MGGPVTAEMTYVFFRAGLAGVMVTVAPSSPSGTRPRRAAVPVQAQMPRRTRVSNTNAIAINKRGLLLRGRIEVRALRDGPAAARRVPAARGGVPGKGRGILEGVGPVPAGERGLVTRLMGGGCHVTGGRTSSSSLSGRASRMGGIPLS